MRAMPLKNSLLWSYWTNAHQPTNHLAMDWFLTTKLLTITKFWLDTISDFILGHCIWLHFFSFKESLCIKWRLIQVSILAVYTQMSWLGILYLVIFLGKKNHNIFCNFYNKMSFAKDHGSSIMPYNMAKALLVRKSSRKMVLRLPNK